MRFSRLELQNWRNFKSADLPLAGRAFIIGPNASGKSNLLDAFRFLRDLVLEGGGLARAVELRGGVKGIRSLHARTETAVTVKTEVEGEDGTGWRYELSFDRKSVKDERPFVRNEVVYKRSAPDGTFEVVHRRPDKEDDNDRERLAQTAIQQVTANRKFRELATFFRSIAYIHLVPQLLREEQPPLAGRLGIDPYGRDLLERIRATPERTRRGRLNRIGKMLGIVVKQFQSLDFELDLRGRPHLVAMFKHWRGQDARQDETRFSDGTLRLIGLLWTLQEPDGPLLLEEPELSLNGAIVGSLAGFLHRAQKQSKGRQVLLSTHSTRLLGDPGIAPEEILLVAPASEGSEVRTGAQKAEIRKLMNAGLTAEEAAASVEDGMDQLELFASFKL